MVGADEELDLPMNQQLSGSSQDPTDAVRTTMAAKKNGSCDLFGPETRPGLSALSRKEFAARKCPRFKLIEIEEFGAANLHQHCPSSVRVHCRCFQSSPQSETN